MSDRSLEKLLLTLVKIYMNFSFVENNNKWLDIAREIDLQVSFFHLKLHTNIHIMMNSGIPVSLW